MSVYTKQEYGARARLGVRGCRPLRRVVGVKGWTRVWASEPKRLTYSQVTLGKTLILRVCLSISGACKPYPRVL